MKQRIAVVGVGLMGSSLARHLVTAGFPVIVHDTDKQGMFERGNSVPNDHFRRLLRRMGPLFAQMSNQMLIVGHTDSTQYADQGYAACVAATATLQQ